jgi:hypothetical protein
MRSETIRLGDALITRVGYIDTAIPAEFVGLDARQVEGVAWGAPHWADGARVRFGAATWVAEIGGQRIAFDPVLAADAVLRAERAAEMEHQRAIARVFAEAGFPVDSIDLVVLSHIEGVGMVAWRDEDGGFRPFFPRARILISAPAREAFERGDASEASLEREAWQALIQQGRVDTFADGESIVPGLVADVGGGHAPGHALMHLRDGAGATLATMLGHLAVSPLHLVTGPCAALHVDPDRAWSLLRAVTTDARLLVGPLWPAPGCGRWRDERVVPGV